MSRVAVDLGRSGARVLWCDDPDPPDDRGAQALTGTRGYGSGPRRATDPAEYPQAPGRRWTSGTGAGLGDPGGAAAAAAAVTAALHAGGASGPRRGTTGGQIALLAVGVPGALTHPDAAAELADTLAAAPGIGAVVVTSDLVAWHAGAFAGRPPSAGTAQVLLTVGTGSAALGLVGGTLRRADGHGLLLGDHGGGARLGQEGLRAALRARDGAGPMTTLAGPADDLLAGLAADPVRALDAAALAAFAPAVLHAAGAGDPVAARIVDGAVTDLLATVDAAARDAAGASAAAIELAVVGGLADELAARLAARGRPTSVPAGAATDGLLLLADDPATAVEGVVVRRARARPPTRAGGPAAAAEVDGLPTEDVHPDAAELDALATGDLVARLLAGQAGAPAAASAAAPALTAAAERLAIAFRGGGRLVYVGAGTSGRLALQDAAELTPTFGLPPERAFALLAGGVDAAGSAVEGAEDDAAAGRADVTAAGVGPDDVVVGVAASGRTPYVLGALAAARERGAATVAVVNTAGSPVAAAADVPIELITGAEVLAGSTRLAAGTAQKIVLNTLTTAALVRAGMTYGPWMVGVRVTNAKLRRRAERIVRDAAGVDEAAARAALDAAGNEVAPALVALLAGLDDGAARSRLAAAGSVRAAVERGPDPGAP